MKKNYNKLIKKVWRKYDSCNVYIAAMNKSSAKQANNKRFSKSLFFVEYVNGILHCLDRPESEILISKYIKHEEETLNGYTKSGKYAKLRKAHRAFFKYFDIRLLQNCD